MHIKDVVEWAIEEQDRAEAEARIALGISQVAALVAAGAIDAGQARSRLSMMRGQMIEAGARVGLYRIDEAMSRFRAIARAAGSSE